MVSRLLQTSFNTSDKSETHIIDGDGVYFTLDDGRRVIDGTNTGCPLGHRHPKMVEALEKAASLPLVNDGWFWPDREKAAEELIDIAFDGEDSWVGAVRFCLSGGEANDLALSLSQAITGRVGVATRERAYHGMVGLSRDVTVQPHWHGGVSDYSGGIKQAPHLTPVYVIPEPLGACYGGHNEPSGERVKGVAATLRRASSVIVDYTQGGIYYDPVYQDGVADAAQKAGSLWIADEVVTGLGRFGRQFAFQGAESRPDIVTLGKPLAGGATGAGAVVISKQLLEELNNQSWRTYSTFRGHPRMIAAIRAHLQVLTEEKIIENAESHEVWLREELVAMAKRHPSVTRVDGRGLHWTIELHGPDWRDWKADTDEPPIATQVTAKAFECGALIGTSGEQTSLFLAPALTVKRDELKELLNALEEGLSEADKVVG